MVIGRERELTRLASELEQGRTVALLGEAGVGKTALLREASARSGRRLSEGGGLATLSWLRYLPVERALGHELPDGDPAWVAGQVEREVGDGVLLLDDLHWADEATLALLPLLHGRVALLTALRRGDPGTVRALEELAALDVEPLPVEPLDDEASEALLGRLDLALSKAAAARLIRQAGGNPLLLEELAVTGEPSESLQLALAARLRLLDEGAREAFALLALAGRPLDPEALSGTEPELSAAGLLLFADGRVTVRHALIGETAAAGLDDEARRRLHARLARLVESPGEAARHHLAAGERDLAFERATGAAADAAIPADRVAHLEVAALCVAGPDADEFRLDVADALGELGLDERALAVLGLVERADPLVRARRELFEGRRLLGSGDVEGARLRYEQGMEEAAGTGSAIEATLAVEAAQVAETRVLLYDLDPAAAEELAAEALRLARGFRRTEALARQLLGTAKLRSLSGGWDDEFRSALALADADGATDLRCRIALHFSFGLLISGRLEEADALTVGAASLAADARLTILEWQLLSRLTGLRWHAGALDSAFEIAERLRADAGGRDHMEFYLCQILVDLGRHEEACTLAEQLVEGASPTWQSLGNALWARTAAELAAGRPRRALDAADRALATFGTEGPTAFLQVSRAWAQHALEIPPDGPAHVAGQPITEGAPAEIEGISLLSQGSFPEAAARFTAAARLWEGRHFRGLLRSTWASGEALRLAGETTAAAERLAAAEGIALAHGHAMLLARIRRSQRLMGERRGTAPRGEGLLTTREREVLGLVGAGLTNAEIARRLGVGRPTVAAFIRSASHKLGARTRMQAAVLATRE